jgi:DNA-binding GntR family transcriptional regulator
MDTSTEPTAPVRAPSAADRVYTYVKDGITSRRFPGDELLGEGQIAAELGVSRTPVREGLLRLEAEGLLRLLPKRGALVLPVTSAEIGDVMETRRLLEDFAVRKVVRRSNRRDVVAALDDRLVEMRAAMAAADTVAYVAADRAFHAAIVASAGNAILAHLYASMRDRQLRMGVANLLADATPDGQADATARMRATLREHQAIRDAIADGSVRAAVAAATEHLDVTQELLAGRR